ncbi:MAG TPA: S9 family peptidase, partial [Bryobacteraceae bacterium]
AKWLAFDSDRGDGGQLYLISPYGGEARKISEGTGTVGTFSFSPDGKRIAYAQGQDENRQLFLYEVALKKITPLAKHSTGVLAFAWSPDSSTLYFTSPDTVDSNERKRMEVHFDVHISNPVPVPHHLWEVSANSSGSTPAHRLTFGDDVSVSAFQVSKNGEWITFTGDSLDRYADPLDRRDSEAYILHVATAKVERLTNNKAPESTPLVSPDGQWVAISAPEEFTYLRRNRVYVRPVSGGNWRMIAAAWPGDVSTIEWSADSTKLYFSDGIGVSEELISVDVVGGQAVQLTHNQGAATAHYQPDTNEFVIAYENPRRPRDYYLVKADDLDRRDAWVRLSDSNPEVENFALGAYETVQWKSSDGTTVEGILVKPVGFEPSKRYPLIVQLHGGPASAYMLGFSANYGTYTHVYAAGGYAVFQPNYRGSANYGEKFRNEIAGDYFRQGFDDIMTGVDALIARGVADPNQLGMMGWSAGGHWCNWALTHTNRFKAISTGAGASNWISMYAETDVHPNREFYMQGTPYDNWDHYVAMSPLRYIRNAKTPTLIHVGQDDPRVPRPQSEELHTALEKLGVPTEFIVYPRMGHGLSEPRYQMVKMMAEYKWFEKWIRGKPGWLNWKELLDTLPSEDPAAAVEKERKSE